MSLQDLLRSNCSAAGRERWQEPLKWNSLIGVTRNATAESPRFWLKRNPFLNHICVWGAPAGQPVANRSPFFHLQALKQQSLCIWSRQLLRLDSCLLFRSTCWKGFERSREGVWCTTQVPQKEKNKSLVPFLSHIVCHKLSPKGEELHICPVKVKFETKTHLNLEWMRLVDAFLHH